MLPIVDVDFGLGNPLLLNALSANIYSQAKK